jgi:DNA-binding XRE family transcriptional regulator
MSGVTPLGGDMSDVQAIRVQAMLFDKNEGKRLYDLIMTGGLPENLQEGVTAHAATPEDDEAAELAAMMGDAPMSGNASPPVAAAPAIQNAGPPDAPKPAKRTRAPSGAVAGAAGALPAHAFEMIRQYVKLKDEDVASALGVSRQTFINYAKGKPALVPTPEQRQALAKIVDEAIAGLERAKAALNG